MQTIQVLAQASGVRCTNILVDSKGTSHAFTIRHVLVPVAEGSRKPTSAVTPCYFCLWCLPWFPEEEFANTGPRSNMFIYAEYHYLSLWAFPFTSVEPFVKQCYLTWVKTSVRVVMSVWQYKSESEPFGSGGAKTDLESISLSVSAVRNNTHITSHAILLFSFTPLLVIKG